MQRITIGLDIAKIGVLGSRRGYKRQDSCAEAAAPIAAPAVFCRLEPALIGIEACGSAHYWARELSALGHEVRLILSAYVKPFVRRNKNDARDVAACTAVGRPDMRFVAIKSVARQASRGLERSRELLLKQHTQLMNSVRGQLVEFSITAA